MEKVDEFKATLNPERRATMTTRKKHKAKLLAVEAVAGDRDLMKAFMKEALQEILEGEMTECLGAAPGGADGKPHGLECR
jgi:transposase-like protein